MKTVESIKAIYREKNISFYTSIAGPLFMGTVHLISTLMQFSWLTFNYCLFSYLLMLIKVLLAYLDRNDNKHRLYLAGALSLCVLAVPMTIAMVKTIMEKDAPVYFFYWMIYLYATYGTVKFVLAVRSRHKARKSGDVCGGILSWISLVAAAYTIQMMEFALIATFDKERSDAMTMMQFFTHGAVIIFTSFVIVYLFIIFVKAKREHNITE